MVTGWYTLAMIPVNVFSKNIATDLTRAILILVTIEIILYVTAAVLISRKIGKKVYKPLHMIEKMGIHLYINDMISVSRFWNIISYFS